MSFNSYSANVDKTVEYNDSEFDFESLCGATPNLEDMLEQEEDGLFWDEISDNIEAQKGKPAQDEDTTNIFAKAGFKLSSLRQQP